MSRERETHLQGRSSLREKIHPLWDELHNLLRNYAAQHMFMHRLLLYNLFVRVLQKEIWKRSFSSLFRQTTLVGLLLLQGDFGSWTSAQTSRTLVSTKSALCGPGDKEKLSRRESSGGTGLARGMELHFGGSEFSKLGA